METQVQPLWWVGDMHDGHVKMIDQRLLPGEEVYTKHPTYGSVADAITDMIIRGAPAIGIAAAYGMFLGVRESVQAGHNVLEKLPGIIDRLSNTRPTAVNLFWALDRMDTFIKGAVAEGLGGDALLERVFTEARTIFEDDVANNLEMGKHGAALLKPGTRILTHCNTGGLATGGFGTALGVIRVAHAQGKIENVWVDETRPYLQGARLTAWELMQDKIPATLITDSMAGFFMQQGMVDAVIIGTDRTVANGDVANKIGSYSLAVLCRHHNIPFYVGAPLSTIDLETQTGADIDIEERSAEEVTHIKGHGLAPAGIKVRHPAFDVTPAELVTGIITEAGVATAPYEESLPALFRK